MILAAVIALLGMGYVFMGREKTMADRLRSGGGTADTAMGLTVRAAGFALLGVIPGSLYLGGAGRSVQAASLCAGLAVQLCWMLPKLRTQEPASLTVAEICAKDRFARAGLGAVEVLSLLSLTAGALAMAARVLASVFSLHTTISLGAAALQNILSGIQGEKLLIVDACYSGALIGRGAFAHSLLPGSRAQSPASLETPFLADPSIHVLTSASGFESSWYYDSEGLSTGAVSYFASALSSGLGLYGKPEADVNGNGEVTLEELRRYLNAAVPSSSVQLLSAQANALTLPVATNTPLARALSGFSYGDCLLESDDPTLEFSYTVTAETAVQYRVVRQVNGGWHWQDAATFLDDGDTPGGLLTPGRKTRELTLDGILEGESGYMMLQVFAVTGSEVILCSERLLAVRPAAVEPSVTLSAENAEFDASARRELVLEARINVPAEITVCIYNAQGKLVRRLASAQLTRPAPGDVTRLYWDGRNDAGERVPAGAYAAALETVIGGERQKATVDITVR